jgi:hypothetical protein
MGAPALLRFFLSAKSHILLQPKTWFLKPMLPQPPEDAHGIADHLRYVAGHADDGHPEDGFDLVTEAVARDHRPEALVGRPEHDGSTGQEEQPPEGSAPKAQ